MSVVKRLVMGLIAVISLAMFGFASSADAAPYTNNLSCTVSIGTAAPGASITISCNGAGGSDTITIVLHSTPVTLGTITANSSGVASGSVTIPTDTPAGTHTLILTDSNGHSTSIPLTIGSGSTTGSGSGGSTGGGLSSTGVAVISIGGLGALL
ncbi:MAG: hypothetical protein J0H43_05295, partial [Actinobacteria bacterium]|nr:hypothetical protein [Actinomycetota bacterium]